MNVVLVVTPVMPVMPVMYASQDAGQPGDWDRRSDSLREGRILATVG